MEGILPAPKACALVVIKAKMTQTTSSVEEPRLRLAEAILSEFPRIGCLAESGGSE